MLKNNSSLKDFRKLSKNELKNITGGAGQARQCPTSCTYRNGLSIGCGNKQCVPYTCSISTEPGYRCEAI